MCLTPVSDNLSLASTAEKQFSKIKFAKISIIIEPF